MLFLALIYVAFVSLGLPDALLGAAWPFMHGELGVAVGSAGYVSMTIACGTIVSSLLSHRVIRRFGTGPVTVASVAMTAIALLGFSVAPSFGWLFACAVPLGLGAGAVDSGLNEFVSEHYHARHMSWLHCFWGVGAMAGPLLLSALTQAGQSWRSTYRVIGVLQCVLVVLLVLSLPMWRKVQAQTAAPAIEASARPKGIFTPLKIKGAPYAMLAFFLYSAIENTMMLWGASYLVSVRNLVAETAAVWVSAFFLGITAGRLVTGFISMKVKTEALIQLGLGVLLLGILLMLLPLPALFTLLGFILLGCGLAPIFPGLLHLTPKHFGQADAQAIMGLQMACAYTGTTLMPPLFGQVFAHASFSVMPWLMAVCAMLMIVFTRRLGRVAPGKTQE